MTTKRPLSDEEKKFCAAKLKLVIDTFVLEEQDSTRLAECLKNKQAVLIQVPCRAVDFVRTDQPNIQIHAYDVPFDNVLKRVPDYLRPELKERLDIGFGAILALTRDGFFRVTYYDPRTPTQP